MKKLILCLAAAVVSLTAAADEGMWLLPYLQKMNIGDMKAKGCQLTAEDIYSVNHGSLKDAIVIFGGGIPLKVDGRIIGGLGISGGTGEEDHSLAEYGLSVLPEIL